MKDLPRTATASTGGVRRVTTSTASSSAVFFEQDALSSVTSLTGAAGATVGRATYDTYGQITAG